MNHPRSIFILFTLILSGVSLSVNLLEATPYLFADEAIYHAMTLSLAYDRDLKYESKDLYRFYKEYPLGPRGIILKQTEESKDIIYAKFPIFSLIAAPFYRVFKTNGYLILNSLAWLSTIYLLYAWWGKTRNALILSIITMVCCSSFNYIFWIHPETIAAFLTTFFLALWRGLSLSAKLSKYRSFLISASLAILCSFKPQMLLLALCPLISWSIHRQWRKISSSTIYFLLCIVVLASLIYGLTDSLSPYSGNRKIFTQNFPFDGPDKSFDSSGDSWSTSDTSFVFETNVFIQNLVYFWTGRFTGVIWYFPLAIVSLFLFFKMSKDTYGKILLPVLMSVVLVQIILIPSNYHGGGGALGNRYFVVYYPAFFLLLPSIPRESIIKIAGIAASILTGIFIVHPFTTSYQPGIVSYSRLHTNLPVEWTLTGSFPIFSPHYRRVKFDDFNGYFYFLNQNNFPPESCGVWIKGDSTSDCLIETLEEYSFIELKMKTIFPKNRIILTTQGDSVELRIENTEPKTARIQLGNPYEQTDLYGRRRYIYTLRINTERGMIPVLELDHSDDRFLGVYIQPFSVTP